MKNSDTLKVILGIILLLVVIAAAAFMRDNKSFVYSEHLDDEILVLGPKDGSGENALEPDVVTLRDFGFYIYRLESFTQQQARKYNHKDPLDYWNTHFSAGEDSRFVSEIARDTAVDACIGDMVYARMAREKGFSLPGEDEDSIDSETDKWMSEISDDQLHTLGLNRSIVRDMVSRQVLAKAYAQEYAKDADLTGYSGDAAVLLSGGGDYFNDRLLSEYDFKENSKIIRELKFGWITVNNE